MKICFALSNFYPRVGGNELLFVKYATELAKRGHQIKVITGTWGDDSRRTENYKEVKIIRYPWKRLFTHPIPFYFVRRDIDKYVEWADVIHTSTYSIAPIVLQVAKKYNKPCVMTVHEVLGKRWWWVTNPFFALFFNIIEKWSVKQNYSIYHVVSEATKKDIIIAGIQKEKIELIYPGVDDVKYSQKTNIVEVFEVKDELKKVFFFVGRFGKPKGLLILLDAIAMLPSDIKNSVIFCFSTDLAEALKKECRKRKIDSLVKIKERISDEDKFDCIKTATAVIVPSITEGFGFSAVEACKTGTLLIASNAGSIPEVIFGKHLLFTNRDSKDLMVKILLALDGKFAETPKKYFSWVDGAEKFEKLYASLLKKEG